MVLENSALFQRFQSSKNKSLVLLISTCLLLTAPASHSFFAIIFGGDIAVKIGLSIPALFGFMYSKRPGDRDRDYNIMYFDAPTISYPSDFDEDAKARTECVLFAIGSVRRGTGLNTVLKPIEGKRYKIVKMPPEMAEGAYGATTPGDSTIYVNYEGKPSEIGGIPSTVFHELMHHAHPHKKHSSPDGGEYSELDEEFWDTEFGKRMRSEWVGIFGVSHPMIRFHRGLKGPFIGPYDKCFGALWPEPDPATFNLNRYIN